MESVSATKPADTNFKLRFHPRVLGTAAPVFPGFEIDICDRVTDEEKPDAVWHRDRAKKMLAAHPEIKELFGPTLSTGYWCVLVSSLQVVMAWLVCSQPLWVTFVAAYVIGSWININLFLLAHECNHHLVFKSGKWNRWLYTFTTLPMFLSGHHTWWVEHHVHHNDMGATKDFIKRRRSFFLATKIKDSMPYTRGPLYDFCSWALTPLFFPYSGIMLITQVLRSAVGLVVYFVSLPFRRRLDPSDKTLAILADEHLVSGYQRYGIRLWGVIYPILSLGLVGGLFFFGGWKAVLYLFLSQLFMTGFLHPLLFGMILSNSHFHGHKEYQPSTSYYGWLNKISFNFGLHTEHHDISGIAWSRLPQMCKMAPEFYDDLLKTNSYTKLAFQFVFCPRDQFELRFDNEIHRNTEIFTEEPSQNPAPVST
ncbi:Fatty acid desaturase [Thalassoglobus neptunius]|uniref:Fatty acid desaturase n=1 Tax=Thalassoglobus neptunius TaxID=1938619 RepID=A0A5C5X5I1_9PLAN|nr:fatty acid desaturase [Thalassoglobus neptunius]TWT57581.1 Fatty acid desaturase [Thalassoglobus neptunius]